MKKIFSILVLLLIFLPIKINAGNATITVKANRSTVIVGQSLTVTATVSADTDIGAWQFDLKYDTSKFKYKSSTVPGLSVVGVYSSPNQKTKTYTFYFTAIGRGDANFWISGASVIDGNEVSHNTKTISKSVKVLTQAELEASYSKNNYLKTLEVEGFEFTEAFDKDKLEYIVNLPPNTTEAVIKAAVEDTRSNLSEVGKVELIDGDNEFLVTVEAQNGSERVYTLNLVVAELDPILVKIGEDNFTVIRKEEQITCPRYFISKEIEYSEETVPACYNETLDFTLIGMKNKANEAEFFIYEKEGFTLYKQVNLNTLTIYPKDIDSSFKLPKNTLKKVVTVADTNIVAYQLNDNKDYYLVNGINVETGEENIYLYDSKEMTMQRYINNENKEDLYFIIIIILSVTTSILLVSTISLFCKIKKRKQKLDKVIKEKLNKNNFIKETTSKE